MSQENVELVRKGARNWTGATWRRGLSCSTTTRYVV